MVRVGVLMLELNKVSTGTNLQNMYESQTRFWTNGGVFSRSVYKAIYCKQKLDPGDLNKYFLQTRWKYNSKIYKIENKTIYESK